MVEVGDIVNIKDGSYMLTRNIVGDYVHNGAFDSTRTIGHCKDDFLVLATKLPELSCRAYRITNSDVLKCNTVIQNVLNGEVWICNKEVSLRIKVRVWKRPPLGLIPKEIYNKNNKVTRFNEVCGAISRYYNEGLQIPINWVEEYNELVDNIKQ